MLYGSIAVSFVIYFVTAFCIASLFQRSLQTRVVAGATFPAALFLLCWVLDILNPMSGEGFLRFNWRSLWMLPGAFVGRDFFVARQPLYSSEQELDWTHPMADGRTLASWHLPRSDRRAIGLLNGSERQEIFRYNHESLGAWGSSFRDGISDGRGGYFVAGLFLMTEHGGDNFPMLHFSADGTLDRSFAYRTRLGMEEGQRLLLAKDGSVWLRVNTAPAPTLQHWNADWTFEGEYPGDRVEPGSEASGLLNP